MAMGLIGSPFLTCASDAIRSVHTLLPRGGVEETPPPIAAASQQNAVRDDVTP